MLKTSRFAILIVVLMSILFFFLSCSDDFNPFTELNGTRADIMSMLQSDDITQRTSINSDNFRFVSNAGTIVTAEPNSFVFRNGTKATGKIDFEITELFAKSEILQYGIPTQTHASILESDGEFLFSASQNGQSLQLADDKVLNLIVPNPDTNPDMELFVVREGSWWPSNNPLNTVVVVDSLNGWGYKFFVNRLEWVNIDYFTKFDLGLTDISIFLPDGYQEGKISLWIVFRDIDVVLNSSGESLPIGEVISVVCIAAQDEDTFRIDIQEVTVEEGLKVNLDPKEESAEKIKKLLKELD